MRIIPPYRPRRRSPPHGCRQRENVVLSPLSALRPPPSAFGGNLQTTASYQRIAVQRIVVHGREAALDEVMVANAKGERWMAPLSMLALDFDVVGFEERRRSVLPSSSSSFCERERRRMRECQSNTANVKQKNYSAGLPRSRPLYRGLRGRNALPLPPLLGSFRTSRKLFVGREADIAVANAGGATKSAGGRRCRCWRSILMS
jgi:hypothetical protein